MIGGYDQAHLECVLTDVYIFFKAKTGYSIPCPDVEISEEVKDSAWYGNGMISLNPKHNNERLDTNELVAHEFFHYVQDRLFWQKMASVPAKDEIDKINELFEGTAFLFAAIWLYNEKKDMQSLVEAYMKDKRHMTKSGVGNRLAMIAYKKGGHAIDNFIRSTLDYKSVSMLLVE